MFVWFARIILYVLSVDLGQVGVHNNETAHLTIESSSEVANFFFRKPKETMINGNSLQTMSNAWFIIAIIYDPMAIIAIGNHWSLVE